MQRTVTPSRKRYAGSNPAPSTTTLLSSRHRPGIRIAARPSRCYRVEAVGGPHWAGSNAESSPDTVSGCPGRSERRDPAGRRHDPDQTSRSRPIARSTPVFRALAHGSNRGKTMKTIFRSTALALGCAIAAASGAAAEEWRFNNPLPETRPESPQIEQWADEVNAALADRRVHASRSTAAARSGSRTPTRCGSCRTGAVEMSLIWANYLGRDAPALSSVFVQGSIGTVEELEGRPAGGARRSTPRNSPTGAWSRPDSSPCRCSKSRSGAPTSRSTRSTTCAGRKLRVWARDQVETFTRLGISAQIIPQEELYVALKTGVVDCAVYPALYAHTVSLQEVAKLRRRSSTRWRRSPYVLGVAPRTNGRRLPGRAPRGDHRGRRGIWDRTNSYDDDHERNSSPRKCGRRRA